MGFLGVVPDEPGGELPVESVEVVGEMLVGLDEAMPQGAVEALVAPVLLRSVGRMRPRWGGKKEGTYILIAPRGNKVKAGKIALLPL